MKLAIFGASGRTGRLLVKGALARGWQANAFVRDGSAFDGDATPGLTVVTGTLDQPDAIARCAAGTDCVVSALGTTTMRKNSVLSDGTARIVQAMRAQDVKRLAVITSLGCGDSRGAVNSLAMRVLIATIGRQIWADKDRQEQVVRASGLDTLIVRPGGLSDDAATGKWRELRGDERMTGRQMIARADVAAYVLARIAQGALGGDCVTLVGDAEARAAA